MIGIRFKIPNEYNNYLKQILENINTQNSIWNIKTDDIIKSDGTYLFAKESYNDKEFQSIIGDYNYYLTFADIECYHSHNFTNIYDYQDFLNSDCYLLIIIVDNVFVDIYAKSKEIINKLKENAMKYKFNDIKIINDLKDKRNTFFI